MLSRELDAPVVSSGVKALHEEAMERAQGHTRRALNNLKAMEKKS